MNQSYNYLAIKAASENLRKAAEEYANACGYEGLKGGQIFHKFDHTISIHMYRELRT